MSTKTKIQWTDISWNPVRGCSMVSAGCENCYAMKQAHRFSGNNKPYWGLTEIGPHGPRWNGNITMVPGLLDEPLHWKKPRRIFVNSMSDLFHGDVSEEFIEQVFVTMARSPRHTYQILTKRPGRMLAFLQRNSTGGRILHLADDRGVESGAWPLPNVWLGVSVEDQATADERIPILLQTPAAVRWISAEPLLGQVDMKDEYLLPSFASDDDRYYQPGGRGLDWVVVGGESGPGARPCDLQWIRSIKDQCQAAGVPVFVKQLGSKAVSDIRTRLPSDDWVRITCLQDKKGGDISEFPEDLRVREYPDAIS
jgi:protein gp37